MKFIQLRISKRETHEKLLDDVGKNIYNWMLIIDSNFKTNNTQQKQKQYFLTKLLETLSQYDMKMVIDHIKYILEKLNSSIVNQHYKELEKTTNLEKIILFMESMATHGINSVQFLNKIQTNEKITTDNLNKSSQWVKFIDKFIEIGTPNKYLIGFIENIIIRKILHYNDITITNTIKDVSIIYPQCLNIFLLSNLDKHFVFKKIYMYLQYTMRYSGKNLGDHIKSIDELTYNNMLILEIKISYSLLKNNLRNYLRNNL